MFDFTDRVVMVTGAAGNLGEATARAFYAADARLALVDNRDERLASVFAGMDAARVCFLTGVNVVDETAVSRMTETTMERFGRIDVLVNVVGGFRKGDPVHEMSLNTWDFLLNLNAKSIVVVAKSVVPHMVAQENGRIINVSSRDGWNGRAKAGAYAAAKSAVLRLTESMAAELKDKGINVNTILPGTIDTPQNREAMPNANFDNWVAPAALADVILFLASPAARAVTGAAVPVFGRS